MEITAADHDTLRTIVLVVLGVLIAVIPLLMITLILRASAAKRKGTAKPSASPVSPNGES